MQKVTTIFLFIVTLLAIFRTATPFLSYKANYTFIAEEMCVYRGTDLHDDCDGYCYLKKNIEEQSGDAHENPNSKKAVSSNQISSLFGILESKIPLYSPFIETDLNSFYKPHYIPSIYLEVFSPPPQV